MTCPLTLCQPLSEFSDHLTAFFNLSGGFLLLVTGAIAGLAVLVF